MIKNSLKSTTSKISSEISSAAVHHIATIFSIDKQQKHFQISLDNQTLTAQLAASCTLLPEEGDVVEILQSNEKTYILSVLERAHLTPAQHRLQGEAFIGTDESYLKVMPAEIELKTSTAKIESNTFNLTAKTGQWIIEKLHAFHEYFSSHSKYSQIKIDTLLKVEAENRETKIKQLDVHETDTLIQKNKQTNLTTNKFNVNR